MNMHAIKASQNKNQAAAIASPKQQSKRGAFVQFPDNRPEAAAQRKLQELANESPQVSQLRSLEQLANNSPQAKQAAQLQSLTNAKFPSLIQQRIANGIGQLARASEEDLIQGKFETAQQQQNESDIKPRQNNTGLPDNIKTGIESLSGMSLDHVKVHYNSAQPAELNALAYAQGSDIHIAPGQERHLPHEAWHVVQQAQGRVKPTMLMKQGVNINDDSRLEQEADFMAAQIVMGNVKHEVQDRTIQQHRLAVSALFEANAKLGHGSIANGGNTVQRVLNAMGKFKVCGKMSAESSASLNRFLAEEEIPNLFFVNDKAILKQKHLDTVTASGEHEKSKGGNLRKEAAKIA